MFGLGWELLIAIVALHLAISLYGAGQRRPFGDLRSIAHLPLSVRTLTWQVRAADWLYVTFIVALWAVLLMRTDTWWPVILIAFAVYVLGDVLTHFIGIVLSFWLALALALIAAGALLVV